MALPDWLDQVPNLSFEREKALLNQILVWAHDLEWERADTAGMDFSERNPTDLVLSNGHEQWLRFAVLPKNRTSQGAIRIQAVPTFKEAEYRWKPQRRKWEVEIGGVPMDRFDDADSFRWLLGRLFAR